MNDDDRARVQELVSILGLAPHPEGGYFVESYRAPLTLPGFALPQRASRAASTAIYFLVTSDEPSTFLHRLPSDEMFHLYDGGALEILLLTADGSARLARLGRDIAAGERPQVTIPGGTWFGTELPDGVPYALVGCTVAPGFDFADLELEAPDDLEIRHPRFAARIERMRRPKEPLSSDDVTVA